MPADTNRLLIRSYGHKLFFIIWLLLIIGSVFIYSSSSVYALSYSGDAGYFLKKQLVGILLGFVAMLIAIFIPLAFIKKSAPYFFLFTLLITSLSLVPYFSLRIHGSSRWIRYRGFSFQPSELLKIGLLLYSAYFLDKKMNQQGNNKDYQNSYNFFQDKKDYQNKREENRVQTLKHIFIPLSILLILPAIILLKQPDFGFTVTLVTTVLCVCVIVDFQARRILFSLLALIPLAIALIFLQPYRLKRITVFLNPWQDPQGSGFQIIQSLIAIGSGGFWGIGIGESRQKFFYLPMQHTDFIFSIIAEEVGFIGVIILILLYILFLYYGLRIAHLLHDCFSRVFVLNATIFISLQALINMMVATGMVPTKGVGLPFVSYGNTGLITNCIMIGIMGNIVYSQARLNTRVSGQPLESI